MDRFISLLLLVEQAAEVAGTVRPRRNLPGGRSWKAARAERRAERKPLSWSEASEEVEAAARAAKAVEAADSPEATLWPTPVR